MGAVDLGEVQRLRGREASEPGVPDDEVLGQEPAGLVSKGSEGLLRPGEGGEQFGRGNLGSKVPVGRLSDAPWDEARQQDDPARQGNGRTRLGLAGQDSRQDGPVGLDDVVDLLADRPPGDAGRLQPEGFLSPADDFFQTFELGLDSVEQECGHVDGSYSLGDRMAENSLMKSISLLGTGLLGSAVVRRLLARGYQVTVWNRTQSKLDALLHEGARAARTPREAVEASEAAVLFLADASAIRETLLLGDAPRALPGKTIIQMGTIGSDESVELEKDFRGAGAEYFEAPVLGSISQALEGSLFVLVGGTAEQLEKWRPLFADAGQPPLHAGPIGKAAALKLALNHLIGTLTSAFAASLALVLRSGVDAGLFMHVLRKSALYAPTFDKKLDKMLSGDFSNPTFPAQHLKKDMDLFVRAARDAGVDPGLALEVSRVLGLAIDQGLALCDYAALSRVIGGETTAR